MLLDFQFGGKLARIGLASARERARATIQAACLFHSALIDPDPDGFDLLLGHRLLAVWHLNRGVGFSCDHAVQGARLS